MENKPLNSTVPTKTERITAALSHAAVIIPLQGLIAPIIIWATQKDKSEYVALQSLQALAWQIMIVFGWFIGVGCYFCSFLGIFLGSMFVENVSGSLGIGAAESIMLVPFLVMGLLMIIWVVFVIYGLVGAVLCLQGKDFRYTIIGPRVERYLSER